MKRALLITLISIAGAAILLPALLFLLPWGALALHSYISPGPTAPQSDYGEFPYTLVYTINGERIEVSDTYVIEYRGTGYNEGNGKYNKWATYSKMRGDASATTHNLLDEYPTLYHDNGIRIYFFLGSAEYYMGLKDSSNKIVPGDIVIDEAGAPTGSRPISNEELLRDYNIEILEKYISDPIPGELQYTEFPVKLNYATGEKSCEIDDILVFAHDDDELYKWFFKSTRTQANSTTKDDLVLYENIDEATGVETRICFAFGSFEYYFGLEETAEPYKTYNVSPGDIYIETRTKVYNDSLEENIRIEIRPIEETELYRKYNVYIFNKSIAPPLSED